MNADQLRRRQMRHNAKRKAHKESIHRRPKGMRATEVKEKVKIVDLDKQIKTAPKESQGFARRLWRRVTGA